MIETLHLHETNSTNDLLQALVKEKDLDEGSMISTDFQIRGRGVSANVWESAMGENVLCSILLCPTFLPIKQQFLISQVVSLAIADVLSSYTQEIYIKWPNDIYWQDKKIAGILIENNLQNSVIATCIIGIGLNNNQTHFQSKAPNPISLAQITGAQYDTHAMAKEIRNAIFNRYIQLIKEETCMLQKEYGSRLYRRTGKFLFEDKNGKFSASIDTVTAEGYLILKREDNKMQKYSFKEVSFILP